MKRLFDILASIIGIIFLFPLMFLLAVAIKLSIGSPILFSQIRPGLNEKPFKLIKFRSMKNENLKEEKTLSDSERITSIGRIIRNYSLDELPELWNILKGDMSFVGPRPLLLKYLPLYNNEQRKRHLVRPGLTGWAQINGRNGISWDEKFKLDVWYVNNRSFLLDLRIIALTAMKVLKKENINLSNSDTMTEFTGNTDDR